MFAFLRAWFAGEPEEGFSLDVVKDDGAVESHRVLASATELTVRDLFSLQGAL